MKKRFFGILLMGAMVFASMSTFTSCKDYDDDIANQQKQIDELTSQIKAIQNLISNGGVVTSVSPIENGVRITMSGDLGSFDITNGLNGQDGAQGPQGEAGQNGKDGKDGVTWTINEDGFWCKDGVATEYYALGTAATTTTTTIIEASPKYYVPNATTGCFDIYQDGVLVESTKISFLGTGSITATMDNNFLTLYGIAGALGPNNSVQISLTSALTSLVFVPELYLDGIESIQYPWICDTILKSVAQTEFPNLSHHEAADGNKHDITGDLHDWEPNTLARNPKAIPVSAATHRWIYGPAWQVKYHLNPNNAAVDYAKSAPNFNVLEPDVIYYNTRGTAAQIGVSSPEKFYVYDNKTYPAATFGAKDGIATVGLQFANPQKLTPWPTCYTHNAADKTYAEDYGVWGNFGKWYTDWAYDKTAKKSDNTVALQMNNNDNTEERITSDYALIVPTRIQLEGLIWDKKPMYKEPGFGPGNRNGDEEGWADNARVHVWDSPEEAIADPDGASLELYCEDTEGIRLGDYLGIHIVSEELMDHDTHPGGCAHGADPMTLKTLHYGEEAAWGLHYEFELVDYYDSSNDTHDSRYASFKDWEKDVEAGAEITGWNKTTDRSSIILPKHVTAEEGKTLNEVSLTSRDREPLVRVLVKNEKGDVLLDGYILLHIAYTPKNAFVDQYPAFDKKFNFCDAVTGMTTWSQFNTYVLHETLGMQNILTFDADYYADCYDSDEEVYVNDAPYVSDKAWLVKDNAEDGHQRGYQMKIYNFGDAYGLDKDGKVAYPPLRGGADPEIFKPFENKALGMAIYYPNGEGTTNHVFSWTLTPEEMEYLTHHIESGKASVTRWIRFKAKNYDKDELNVDVDNYLANYPYVWVKMTINLTRDVQARLYTEKINNYWYHFNTGAETGWSGILLDVEAPRNNETIKDQRWVSPVNNTIVGNKAQLLDKSGRAKKYDLFKYYFAPKTYQIKTLEGRTYNITPQRSAGDTKWDNLFCKYHWKHVYEYTTGNFYPTKPEVLTADNAHKWEEAKLEATLAQCAINYNDGAFTNTILYANPVNTTTYYPIAEIDATNGDIELIHWVTKKYPAVGNIAYDPKDNFDNEVAYEVLNAIGYLNTSKKSATKGYLTADKISTENIEEELRAWVGVVADYGCGVAKYVEQDKTDAPNVATFLASWERPINVDDCEDIALDATTTENYFFLVDYLKMFDWRGPEFLDNHGSLMNKQGYMYADHFWFWPYYNVKAITVDLNPANVLTNMHQDDATKFVKLNSITTKANLWQIQVINEGTAQAEVKYVKNGANTKTYEFDLLDAANEFNRADNNSALKAFMGISPVRPVNKARFGGFYYANNGDNVTVFDVKIPIRVHYEWGSIPFVVTWKINTTHNIN